MSDNVFLDKAVPPTPEVVAKALGTRAAYLEELKQHIQGPLVEEWKYYGKTLGWTLKLLRGRRNLCFVAMCRGCFAVGFVFGDKAVKAAQQSALPPDLVQELVGARRYVEGRGIQIVVKSRRALAHAKLLLDIKQAN